MVLLTKRLGNRGIRVPGLVNADSISVRYPTDFVVTGPAGCAETVIYAHNLPSLFR